MSWFLISGAGFFVGWWMCAATWPRYTNRPRPQQGTYNPSQSER